MTASSQCLALAILMAGAVPCLRAEWPTLHGNPQRTGFVGDSIQPPYRLAWVRQFKNERLGTAMEPIVAEGRVFVATHQGNLYALNAATGAPLWRFRAHGAFLHSPACAPNLVVAASADGSVYGVGARDGRLEWRYAAGGGGFSASPAIAAGAVFIGTRAGEFLALRLGDGKRLWRRSLEAPIRQTAAYAEGRVYVTSEDLRVHCLDARSGGANWVSAPLLGQTARDYYPVVVRRGGRTVVVVRTNPILTMSQRIGRDRHFLCENAGVDDSGWQKVDAWIKSDQARGTPELQEKEQRAIVEYLQAAPDAKSFFVLDAETGKEFVPAPVLWIAGCQAAGAPPALTRGQDLFVFYRSAYGNWNHGVAPLVALGILRLEQNRVRPLFHTSGKQPPWNTFWGTADESQSFVVANNTALIVHQGTLSGFDLDSQRLFHIWGDRDTYGGFRSPPWARNEWHGPGRGAVAVDGPRLFWLTGSRVLCLEGGGSAAIARGRGKELPASTEIDGSGLAAETGPAPEPYHRRELRRRLRQTVAEILSARWAPLFVDPGLAGRDFSFDDSGELFEALGWAYPHLPEELQRQVKERLAAEWSQAPPFSRRAWYPLEEGHRREWFWIPKEYQARRGQDKPHHPFGNVSAVWWYAERCGEQARLREAWPELHAAFEDFEKSNWRLDPERGDLSANRYLASLRVFARLAEAMPDPAGARRAEALADQTADALLTWWRRAARGGTLTRFKGSAELDPFIGKGDALSLRLAPHRHKVALFHDLTPDIAAWVRREAPAESAEVWRVFEQLYATWPLMGEERQVHYGENFVDPPDLALGAFKAAAWLASKSSAELAVWTDVPFCKADLYYATKLAIALERAER